MRNEIEYKCESCGHIMVEDLNWEDGHPRLENGKIDFNKAGLPVWYKERIDIYKCCKCRGDIQKEKS